jgi:hypothetical protein
MWRVGRVGIVMNEENDIVTRVESTPKKKVRLQGVNLHNYTREQGGVMERRDQKEWKVGSINGYPVPRERHIITEQWENRESHVWYPRRRQGTQR